MDKTKLRWNGWGLYDAPDVLGEKATGIWRWLGEYLGIGNLPNTPAVALDQASLEDPRLSSAQCEDIHRIIASDRVRTDAYERAYHARGRSYHDLLYLRNGDLWSAPDAIIYPKSIEEVEALVTYAAANDVVLIPYGGGSSVVGGVTPRKEKDIRPVLTVDMALMARILGVDRNSMMAHVETGIYGPDLERQLQEQGVTLGHYPQSFEFSTLGGWIAARGAGHQSNKYGKAEDWFIAARVITPTGIWITEKFPKSGAGPLVKDLVPGSEGTFGIITDAWVHLHEVPEKKEYRAYIFPEFESGVDAVRRLMQQPVPTAMVRLSDANETFFYSVLHGGAEVGENGPLGFCLMLVGFEGQAEQVDAYRAQADTILAACGGADMGTSMGELWLSTRFETPYLRDPMLDRGLGVDTVETAVDWGRLLTLHDNVTTAMEDSLRRNHPRPGAKGIVMAHVSHSYRNGASLYFTFIFPRKLESPVEQWQAIKNDASNIIVEQGGTISHHHGVGMDHLPWMQKEKGLKGQQLLKQLKKTLDPKNIMNPGKLIDLTS